MIVMLWNIRSVYNVASMFRTSDAADIEKIYLVGITPAPRDRFGELRPDFHKVALGAERSTAWEHLSIARAKKLLPALKKQGYSFAAVEQHKQSIPYYRLPQKYKFERLVLFMGHEVRGLPASVLKIADRILEIPMHGKVLKDSAHLKNQHPSRRQGKESLNVSVAFGIIVFGLRYGA